MTIKVVKSHNKYKTWLLCSELNLFSDDTVDIVAAIVDVMDVEVATVVNIAVIAVGVLDIWGVTSVEPDLKSFR